MKQPKFKVFGDKMLHMKQVNHEMAVDKRTENRKLGDLGETIACEFLVKRGFTIVERNYLRKWGEIDVVACETAKNSQKGDTLHFIEVKTVTRNLVIYETQKDWYRPEDNLHPWKLKRLSRAIQTYLMESKHVSHGTDWQFDVITVFIDPSNGQSRVEWLEDIIL